MSFHLYLAVYTTTILVVLTCTLNVSCQDTRDSVSREEKRQDKTPKTQAVTSENGFCGGCNINETKALEKFKTTYSEFHKNLTSFIALIPTTLEKEVPSYFEKVKLLLSNLTVNDTEFIKENLKDIVKGWYYMQAVTENLLKCMVSLVKSASQAWYQEQKKKLEWWMFQGQTDVESMKQYPKLSNADVREKNSSIFDRHNITKLETCVDSINKQVDEIVKIVGKTSVVNSFKKRYTQFHKRLTDFITGMDNNTYLKNLNLTQKQMIDTVKKTLKDFPLNDTSFTYQSTLVLSKKWTDLSEAAGSYLDVLPSLIKPQPEKQLSLLQNLISMLKSDIFLTTSYAIQLNFA
ncbi:uncharacterized protein LOC131953854 [Physella acuta]|uniref:uncharacterized protein LOC131953854 n=1 Tax=Physella acuta TaxID=109671 RepID=UPI0027DB182F|nr:uncharacterized protein LOC131953854 [Physella acuta]